MTWPYRDSQVRAAAPILTRDLEALLSLIASAPRDSQELTGTVVLVRWGSIRMFTVLLIANRVRQTPPRQRGGAQM
jgi:hypothetical protein